MEQIEIQYSLDKETLKKAYKSQFNFGRLKWAIPVFIVIISLNILGNTYLVKEEFKQPFTWSSIIPYFVPIILLVSIIFFTRGRWADKILNNVSAQGPFTWIFTQNNITTTSPVSKSEVKWSYYKKIKIDDDIVMAYPNDTVGIIIPISAFTPEQFAQFKIWAKANVKQVIG